MKIEQLRRGEAMTYITKRGRAVYIMNDCGHLVYEVEEKIHKNGMYQIKRKMIKPTKEMLSQAVAC